MTAAEPITVDRVVKTINTINPRILDHHRKLTVETRRDLILFFCQGHQLAHNGQPLFTADMVRTSDGVSVDVPTDYMNATESPGTGHLNTIGAAMSRYASLVMTDLRALVQLSDPWQQTPIGQPIAHDALQAWFTRDAEQDDPADERPSRALLAAWARKKQEASR